MSNTDDSKNTVPMLDTPPPKEAAATVARSSIGVKAWMLGWFARHKFLTFVVLLVGSCSFSLRDRHVSWEEEVPLNTGETIWVKRELLYTYRGGAGNPFDMDFRPNWTETLSFEWRKQRYSYTGAAKIMLVAISPTTQQPILVANATSKLWDEKNGYGCTIPFYVQFYQETPGGPWRWPTSIEPWLFDLPHNVMIHTPDLGDVQKRYLLQDRQRLDDSVAVHSPSYTKIDKTFQGEDCINRGKK